MEYIKARGIYNKENLRAPVWAEPLTAIINNGSPFVLHAQESHDVTVEPSYTYNILIKSPYFNVEETINIDVRSKSEYTGKMIIDYAVGENVTYLRVYLINYLDEEVLVHEGQLWKD